MNLVAYAFFCSCDPLYAFEYNFQGYNLQNYSGAEIFHCCFSLDFLIMQELDFLGCRMRSEAKWCFVLFVFFLIL